MKFKQIPIILLLLCSLLSCSDNSTPVSASPQHAGKKRPSGPPPANVETRPLRIRPLKVSLGATGLTVPYRKSRVAAAVSGRVVSVAITEGQKVKKGEVLVTLDDELRQLRIEEKQAQLRQLQAELKRLTAGNLPEEIQAQRELVQENQAQLQSLAAELTRKKNLYQDQNISKTQWDEIRYAYQAQQARLKKAKSDLALIERGFREELKESARAQVDEIRAQLNQEQYFLEQTRIRAPFDALVLKREVERGEWVKEGASVAIIIQVDKIKVIAFVPEDYISMVKAGKTRARIKIDALPHAKDLAGTVIEIVPQGSLRDHNFEVRVVVDNPDDTIRPGMSCRAFAVFKDVPQALMIHRDAFSTSGQKTTAIKVEKDGTAKYIAISVGDRDGDWFEVLDSRELLLDIDAKPGHIGHCVFASLWRMVKGEMEIAHKNAILGRFKSDTLLWKKYRAVEKDGRFKLYSPPRLSAGDRVVVTNNPYVYPGAKVIVVREYP